MTTDNDRNTVFNVTLMSEHDKPLLFFYDTEPDEVLPEYAKYKARISGDLRAAITASLLKEGRDTWLDPKFMADVFTEDREDIVNSYNKVIADVEARIEDDY
jgi:hypothetical protein